ncbi:MAG: hypothetical protein C5B50_04515 [Verrucomicrobia bacterium]|nr:MAG: hypothetical protein C5B50_04515 [Verrucomicrobiota bacterium]
MKAHLLAGLIAILSPTVLFGQWQIAVDENGHSNTNSLSAPISTSALPWMVGPDPTDGLMNWNSVLIYTLPFAGVRGDVLVQDPVQGSPILDVLRFDGANHLIFYSDSIDGYDSLADTPGPPNPFLPLIAGPYTEGPAGMPEGQPQWIDYAPNPNMPGGDPSNPVYRFYSEVPEPLSGLIALNVLGAFAGAALRRRNLNRS